MFALLLLCVLHTLSIIIILSLSLCYYNVSHIITVFFSETIGSNSADVNLTCKKMESFSQITTVILQLQPSKDNHYYNITCDGRSKDFHFSSLSEETKYKIQSVWESENATQYCQVMEFYTCKFNSMIL